MANFSNDTLCSIFANSMHHNLNKHRCETEMDQKASYKYGIAAGYYVIVVILFYGTSVVFLIASYIKRKHRKILEDRQINSYLKEFQVVKDSSSRDNYRNLKRSMIAKLSKMGMFPESGGSNANHSTLHRCLSKTILPVTAVALSPGTSMTNVQKNVDDHARIPLSHEALGTIKECEETFTHFAITRDRMLNKRDGPSATQNDRTLTTVPNYVARRNRQTNIDSIREDIIRIHQTALKNAGEGNRSKGRNSRYQISPRRDKEQEESLTRAVNTGGRRLTSPLTTPPPMKISDAKATGCEQHISSV